MANRERRKGAEGERQVANIFRAHGFDCDRTPNSGGLRFKGDLYGLAGVHIEVKRQETARPWAWIAQAEKDAWAETEAGRHVFAPLLPVVAFRRNASSWYAIVPLEELARLLAETQA
jgi:Holliday junction resolvase